MWRNHLTCLTTITAATLALGGCATEPGGPPPLLHQLPRPLTAAEQNAVAASNDFAFAIFRQINQAQADSNVFVSPLSMSMALGMTLNGAAGATVDAMRSTLGFGTASNDAINQGYRGLIDLLRGLDRTTEFELANSIWARQGIPFQPAFLQAGRTYFDAEIQSLDFASPDAVPTINQWVSQKTSGKIPTILDQIDPDEVMFLINAIYFKGNWRQAFDAKQTTDATFHAVGGDQTVRMMRRTVTAGYLQTAGLQALELLYGNGAFAMVLVLPPPGTDLSSLAGSLTREQWEQWLGGLKDRDMPVALPKFRLEYKRSLKPDLSALGMGIAFDPNRSDFSRLVEPRDGHAYLTRVDHKTFVDVNEEGTEAAAVTSVGVGFTSAPQEFRVDRPFLVALRERLSGTILFVAKIVRVP